MVVLHLHSLTQLIRSVLVIRETKVCDTSPRNSQVYQLRCIRYCLQVTYSSCALSQCRRRCEHIYLVIYWDVTPGRLSPGGLPGQSVQS